MVRLDAVEENELGSVTQTCARFYDVTAIPVSCRDERGAALFRFPTWAGDFSGGFLGSCLSLKDASPAGDERPLILAVGQHHLLAILPVSARETLLFGPVNIAASQGIPPQVFESLSRQPPIPQMSYPKFLNAVLLLAQLCTGKTYDPADLLPVDTPAANTFDARTGELLTLADSIEPGKVDFSMYSGEAYEQHFLQAIERGDTQTLLAALKTPVDFELGQMSLDPVRQQKYLFIAFMTMAARAAVRGGLPPGPAYDICNEYCRRMDRSGDIQKISALLLQMAEELSEGVKKHSRRVSYSAPVRACCDYIDSHLYAPISLADLARTANLCQRTISQRFHAEVGQSPVDYIHAERIRVAKLLLQYTPYTILDISGSLQFSSQSHFTKVFREREGMTPMQYRRQAKG